MISQFFALDLYLYGVYGDTPDRLLNTTREKAAVTVEVESKDKLGQILPNDANITAVSVFGKPVYFESDIHSGAYAIALSWTKDPAIAQHIADDLMERLGNG